MEITNVSEVVHLSSNVSKPCPYCDVGLMNEEDIGERINHYLKTHGLTLFHVGSETELGDKQQVFHYTVAVLGRA